MSQLFNYGSDLFLEGSNHPHYMRARAGSMVRFEQREKTTIESLPDDLLKEVLRRLHGGRERGACTLVSKRWLMCLCSIPKYELKKDPFDFVEEIMVEAYELPTKTVEGVHATDVRLAAVAVGMSLSGGLGALVIKGSNPALGVTSLGLTAIARCCPSLKILRLEDVPTIGYEGLIEIANCCNQLEMLELVGCPMITDKALVAIARGCPNLSSVTIESCKNVRNEGLVAIGKYCSELMSVTIKDCPLVRDHGVSGLLFHLSEVVTTVNLSGLTISDVSLAVIGHYCLAVTQLTLSGLQHVGERGFWCMGKGQGLRKLEKLVITSCRVTDVGLESIGIGCPKMNYFCLKKCSFLSDNGLVSFGRAAVALKTLSLVECHRVTQYGLFGLITNCNNKLKAISVSSCFGIKDMPVGVHLVGPWGAPHSSLESLTICNCPLFGDANLVLLSTVCTELHSISLLGLPRISDNGLVPLIENSDDGLVSVKLTGCVNLTDETGSTLMRAQGGTLEIVDFSGCPRITDATLVAISEYCLQLYDLNVSRCRIGDMGISAMSECNQLVSLSILSVAGCTLISDNSFPRFKVLGRSLRKLDIQHCYGLSRGVVEMLDCCMRGCEVIQ